MENKRFGLLSDAFIVAGAPALGYFYAYAYDRAYLAHFGVGREFVSVDIGSIALAMSSAILFIVLVYTIVDNLVLIFGRLPIAIYVEHFLIPVLATYMAYIFWSIGELIWVQALLVLLAIAVWITAIAVPLYNRKKLGGFANAVKINIAGERKVQENFLTSKISKKIGALPIATFYGLLVLLPWLFDTVGTIIASNQKQFELYNNNGDWLLLQKKSDEFIFSGYDRISNKITHQTLILKQDSKQNIQLMFKKFESAPTMLGD